MDQVSTYNQLLAENSAVSNILTAEMAEAVFACNDHTVKSLSPVWSKNMRKNITLFHKHGTFVDQFGGFGLGKAVICVGAGPSFNRNKEILKIVNDINVRLPLHMQPFIIVASNKQLKPLLDLGIYPHFTLLIDAGDALLPQFKIPAWAQKDCFLISGLHCSNKILKQWDRQGGRICFYLIGQDDEKQYFKKETGKNPETHIIQQGGNVLNTMWILSQRVLGASTFIMCGNDLSYPLSADENKRQQTFYADGDYRLNILNRRDEAKEQFAWMGFDLYQSAIAQNQLMYDLSIVGTSKQLWVYKTWLEVQAAIWAEKKSFFIFNASEAGICGVLARSYEKAALKEKSNWFLIDEILPKRWLTTSLEKACKKVLEAKKCLIQMGTRTDASVVVPWRQKMDSANDADRQVKCHNDSGIIL